MSKKKELIEHIKGERAERSLNRKREQSAIQIQKAFRKYILRIRAQLEMRKQLDSMLENQPQSEDEKEHSLWIIQMVKLWLGLKKNQLNEKHHLEDKKRRSKICSVITSYSSVQSLKVNGKNPKLAMSVLPLAFADNSLSTFFTVCQAQALVESSTTRAIIPEMTMIVTLVQPLNWSLYSLPAPQVKEAVKRMCHKLLSKLLESGMYQHLSVCIKNGYTQLLLDSLKTLDGLSITSLKLRRANDIYLTAIMVLATLPFDILEELVDFFCNIRLAFVEKFGKAINRTRRDGIFLVTQQGCNISNQVKCSIGLN